MMTPPAKPSPLRVLASAPTPVQGKKRGPTRGATLNRVQEVAQAAIGDASPLDAAFAAFAAFDAPPADGDAQSQAQAVRLAQDAVRRLLAP